MEDKSKAGATIYFQIYNLLQKCASGYTFLLGPSNHSKQKFILQIIIWEMQGISATVWCRLFYYVSFS